jgi:hypothetical protein
MKLIIQTTRIAATATDDYTGPEQHITAPADFDISRMADYTYSDGVLTLTYGTRITRLAFRNRFTLAEKVALEIASLDNPAATMAEREQAAALRVNLADTATASYIDLSDAATRAGVQQLEASGLLAEGRALEVLDAAVTADEVAGG